MLAICPACKGRKETMSAGMITTHKCVKCLGVGHIEQSDEVSPVEQAVVTENEPAPLVMTENDNKKKKK